jgi:hypothetical protein
MNLQENISRIRSMMGLIIETKENGYAPWGIIFDGENKILVGDMHQTPIELSKDLEKKVISIANKYGYYGEGIGLEYNKAVTDSKFYKELDPKMYKGSWDEKLIKSGKIKNNDKKVFLYALFSNVTENHRLKILMKQTKKGETILELLHKTIPTWSAEMGEFNLNKKDVEDFLKSISEDNVDFFEMSKKEVTKENLKDFLTKGEELQWPKNWQEYPFKAGKVARKATTIRDKFLINTGQGVYFVGAGHLKDIIQMKEGEGLKLFGGEKI